jgi:signal peptidase I
MNRKTQRKALRLLSRLPGAYSLLAFVFAHRVSVWGRSMEPELHSGEALLFDKLAYVRGAPRRGDIVLIQEPGRKGLRMVKRIKGIPGDISGDDLVLNEGEYWVEGDNAAESTDSRTFGPVRRSELLGRAWIRYWPRERWKVLDQAEARSADVE